jgi:hypothetical protein
VPVVHVCAAETGCGDADVELVAGEVWASGCGLHDFSGFGAFEYGEGRHCDDEGILNLCSEWFSEWQQINNWLSRKKSEAPKSLRTFVGGGLAIAAAFYPLYALPLLLILLDSIALV